jgi:hypothetical protein
MGYRVEAVTISVYIPHHMAQAQQQFSQNAKASAVVLGMMQPRDHSCWWK